jgi:archaellum component FlaC
MEQLFALKRDLDMVTQDVQQLKKGYTSLDFIAHTVKNMWDEQVCQSEQMTRIEVDMKNMYEHMDGITEEQARQSEQMTRMEGDIKGLKADVAELKSDVAELKADVKFIRAHLSK